MNREILFRDILFRGKRKDNGEWVEGVPVSNSFITCIFKLMDGISELTGFEVKSKTVGQFTGLCDRNGKKVFEGDIVVWDYDKVDFDGSTHSTPELVRWDKDYCGFIINHDDMGTIDSDCRVIGNIFDNPDLKILIC